MIDLEMEKSTPREKSRVALRLLRLMMLGGTVWWQATGTKKQPASQLKRTGGNMRAPTDLCERDPDPVSRVALIEERRSLVRADRLGRERASRFTRRRSPSETSKPDVQTRQWRRRLILASAQFHGSPTHGATTRIRKEGIFTLGTLPHKTHSYPR